MVYWGVTHIRRQQILVALPFKCVACAAWKSVVSASCCGSYSFQAALNLQWGSLSKEKKLQLAVMVAQVFQCAPALAVWDGGSTVKSLLCFGLAGCERIWDMLRLRGGRGTGLQQSACYSQRTRWQLLFCIWASSPVVITKSVNLSSRSSRVCRGWEVKRVSNPGNTGCTSSSKRDTIEQFLHQPVM